MIRALTIYLLAAGAVSAVLLGGRFALVHALGDSLRGLPELQVEHLNHRLSQKPASEAKVLVLGDSTAVFSVVAADLPATESFALVDSTSIESYFTMKRILASGARPRCVLLSSSLTWKANHGRFFPMFVGGGFYSDEELEEIYGEAAVAGDPPARGGRMLFRALQWAYRTGVLDGFAAKRMQEALWGEKTRQGANRIRDSLSRGKGSYPVASRAQYVGRSELTYDGAPEMNRLERVYLGKFFSLLESAGIQLYVLQVPFADTVPPSYATDYRKKLEEEFTAVHGSRPAFTILAPPPLPARLYLGAGHLTLEGGKLLQPYLLEAMRKCQ